MARKKEEKLPPGVRKRGKGYTFRYSIPITKENGKPGRKQKETVAFPTSQAAYETGVKIKAKILNGTYVDEDTVLFTDWAVKGVELHAAAKQLKENTVDVMKSNLKYAKIAFSGKKLKDLTPVMYQSYLMDLRDKYNLGESGIKGAHMAMRVIFKLAVKLEILAKDITKEVDLPSTKPTFEQLEQGQDAPLPDYLEKEQLAALLKAAKQRADEQTNPEKAFGARQHYRAIYFLAHTGLRIGELCALETSRIDTKIRTVRVIANLYRRMGITSYKLVPPKNKASIRTVDISKSIASVLDSQLHDLKVFKLLVGKKHYGGRNFAFVSYKRFPGYPLDPATFNADLLETLTLAGLPPSITAHSLRHTFTSLSAEAGASLVDIQKQLGHASDEMTKRVYLHVTEARRRANVEKLDNLMSNLLSDLN